MHAISPSKYTGVDGFAGDVAADDTGDDDLKNCQWTSILYLSTRLVMTRHTVGNARPNATLDTNGPADSRAGEATLSPA